MANEKTPRDSVEQHINWSHSGIFSASLITGKFSERVASFVDCEDDLDFDPLSFNGLCDAIHWDTLGFSHTTPLAGDYSGEVEPLKRDHDLVWKLMEVLRKHSNNAEVDRVLAFAVQLGMAYQRLLLRPAEEMAIAAATTKKQQKSLSKNRLKITADKACELCEQIQKANPDLDTRSVAKIASNQYKKEAEVLVKWETIRRHWLENRESWRARQDAELRIRKLHLEFLNQWKGNVKRRSDSSSGTEKDDIPW